MNKKRMDYKKGQIGFTQVLLGVIILFVVIIGIVSLLKVQRGNSWENSLETSIDSVSKGFVSILGPLTDLLLGTRGKGENTQFLMIIVFILISIIVVGTLDSINIFGEEKKGGLINLFVGIIVSIIGVRFMPENMWESLTAPSSAFVALILVGAPFLALFFVTIKIKFNLARKLLWLFYIIFMSYLIFFPEEGAGLGNEFMWIYIVFLIFAGIMMATDASVIRFLRTEKVKRDLAWGVSEVALVERAKKQKELKEFIALRSEYKKGSQERKDSDEIIRNLKEEIKELGKASGD
jgi:hypothetical protein